MKIKTDFQKQKTLYSNKLIHDIYKLIPLLGGNHIFLPTCVTSLAKGGP